MDVAWRVIGLKEWAGALNMALDEAVAQSVRTGAARPTIRFYGWNPSCVTIGYHQGLLEEVNVQECRRLGFDIVRRMTGGGAVFHDRFGEITYSVIAPQGMFAPGIIDSYRQICGWIISGLLKLGIHAEFKPINDVAVEGKKISGNAQTRRGGVLQQHGTILFDLDVPRMFSVLSVGKEKISDKKITQVQERVTSIIAQSRATREQAYQAMLEAFTEGKQWAWGDFSKLELAAAQTLAKEKYSARDWNYLR